MLEHGMSAIRKHLASLPPSDSLPVEVLRAAYDKAEKVFGLPDDVTIAASEAGGVPAERLSPANAAGPRTILYLHGGGYVLGSPRSHRHMIAHLARAARASAVAINYRLAPEHPFPAAVEDAVSAYRGLLNEGVPASSITLAGDSAGGGLTAAALVAIGEEKLPMAGAGVCLSPWTDLTNSAESYTSRAAADPMVTRSSIERWTEAYLGGADPRTPLASPAHASLRGLPPLLIQVGEDEVLVDDARLLASRAEAAGVDVTLEVWEGMIHVWHWFAEYLDEAARATARVGEFIERKAP